MAKIYQFKKALDVLNPNLLDISKTLANPHYVIGNRTKFIAMAVGFYDHKFVVQGKLNILESKFSATIFHRGGEVGRISPVDDGWQLTLKALKWCRDNRVKHLKIYWNQDPWYFVRVLCQQEDITLHDGGQATEVTGKQLRFGGYRIDKIVRYWYPDSRNCELYLQK
jgi:hypothetical protein